MPRWKILRMLNRHGVSRESWGTGTNRTLDDLFRYHEKDRLYFRNGSSKEFTIDVHAAIVIITHRFQRKWLELYEDRQEANGEILKRSGFNGIAETARRQEKTMRESAIRCLAEELNFHDQSKYELSDCLKIEVRDAMKSEKWPGIMAVYHRYLFECEISRSLFNADGYVEQDGNRTIYFKWKPREQLQLCV
jgi:hypothetical protein